MNIKPVVVKIDETEYWHPDIVEKAGKLYGLWLYDSNRVTHCCELTGSYEMHGLSWESELSVDETMWDEIQTAWSVEGPDLCYMHTTDVEKLESRVLPLQRCKKDEYDECWQSIIEHYRCNVPM